MCTVPYCRLHFNSLELYLLLTQRSDLITLVLDSSTQRPIIPSADSQDTYFRWLHGLFSSSLDDILSFPLFWSRSTPKRQSFLASQTTQPATCIHSSYTFTIPNWQLIAACLRVDQRRSLFGLIPILPRDLKDNFRPAGPGACWLVALLDHQLIPQHTHLSYTYHYLEVDNVYQLFSFCQGPEATEYRLPFLLSSSASCNSILLPPACTRWYLNIITWTCVVGSNNKDQRRTILLCENLESQITGRHMPSCR